MAVEIRNNRRVKTTPGFFFTQNLSGTITSIGYADKRLNDGSYVSVPLESLLFDATESRPRFGYLLQVAFATGTVVPDESTWPTIYDIDGNVIGKGLQLINTSQSRIREEVQHIFNYIIALLVSFEPGNVQQEGLARSAAKQIVKYLNLLDLVPILFAGDPAKGLAQQIGLDVNPVDFPYPDEGYPAIFNEDDLKELLDFFFPSTSPTSLMDKTTFLYSRVIPETRRRLNSSLLLQSQIDNVLAPIT